MSLQRCRQPPVENRDPLLILEPRKGVRMLLHRVRDLLYCHNSVQKKRATPVHRGSPSFRDGSSAVSY